MQKIHKLTAVCAVFFIALFMFGMAAHAEYAEEYAEMSHAPESYVSSVPPEDFTVGTLPPGTGTVANVFHDEDGRRFYTIQTPAGNTFYLIIDFNQQMDNVFFLNAVTERDLIALAERDRNVNPGGGIGLMPGTNTDDEDMTNSMDSNTIEAEPTSDNNNSTMILVVIVMLAGGGAVYYFKVHRKKHAADIRDEYEDDEPEEYIEEDYDSEPWDEDSEEV